MKLYNDEAVLIFTAIIEQAIDDYRVLVKKNTTCGGDKNTGKYTADEIKSFFGSEWCESILQDGLRVRRMTGADVFRAISST